MRLRLDSSDDVSSKRLRANHSNAAGSVNVVLGAGSQLVESQDPPPPYHELNLNFFFPHLKASRRTLDNQEKTIRQPSEQPKNDSSQEKKSRSKLQGALICFGQLNELALHAHSIFLPFSSFFLGPRGGGGPDTVCRWAANLNHRCLFCAALSG